MKILTNEQYKLFLAQQRRIEHLHKEINQLRKENSILTQAITAQNIDFPNSANYQLADYETDFPGENPEDIF